VPRQDTGLSSKGVLAHNLWLHVLTAQKQQSLYLSCLASYACPLSRNLVTRFSLILQAAVTLKQYGKILVTHRPGETTAILLKLCTQGLAPAQETPNRATLPTSNGNPSTAARGGPPTTSPEASTSGQPGRGIVPGGEEEMEPILPSPMDFVHVFVDRPRWLLRFFEQYSDKLKARRLLQLTWLIAWLNSSAEGRFESHFELPLRESHSPAPQIFLV
jgi:hypothetical protein